MLTLVGLGILLHESVYFASHGRNHFDDDLMPVLGLRMRPRFRRWLHLTLALCALAVLVVPDNVVGAALLWLTLTVVIAGFPKRLPNHLIVAWFLLLVLLAAAVDNGSASAQSALDSGGTWTIGLLAAATYGIAALHKLNHDFLNPRTSAGSGLIYLHLTQLGFAQMRLPRAMGILVIYCTIAFEFITSALLLLPEPMILAIILTSMLIVAFGLLGHSHFSIVMTAAIFGYGTGQIQLTLRPSIVAIMIPLAAAVAYFATNFRVYRHPRLALLNYVAMIVIVAVASIATLDQRRTGGAEASLPGFIVLVAFLLNGLAPYFGLKQEFSLAMFSNLRPDRWNHLLIRRHPPLRLQPTYLRMTQCDPLCRRFLQRSDGWYSLGFLCAVEAKVRREPDFQVPMMALDAAGQMRKIDSLARTGLGRKDRLCLYPIWLPEHSEPVLG